MHDAFQLSLHVPRRSNGLQVREIEGETVILDPRTERMHSLNPTAAYIFESIDGQRTVEQIWKELADGFEIALELAERDTKVLVAQLRQLRVIE